MKAYICAIKKSLQNRDESQVPELLMDKHLESRLICSCSDCFVVVFAGLHTSHCHIFCFHSNMNCLHCYCDAVTWKILHFKTRGHFCANLFIPESFKFKQDKSLFKIKQTWEGNYYEDFSLQWNYAKLRLIYKCNLQWDCFIHNWKGKNEKLI